MLAMSLKCDILKFGTLMWYRTELVTQSVQKMTKISDFSEVMSRPRVWFVGPINIYHKSDSISL